MKKLVILLGFLLGAALAARASTDDGSMAIATLMPAGAISEAPPTPCVETPTSSPGADYCWINGHWMWDHNRWIWKNGRWERRPFSGAIWEPGRWRLRNDGYIWTEGRWKTHGNQPVPSLNRTSELVVPQEPPLPCAENIPPSPGPDYLWVRGHWVWQDHWVWTQGHYKHRPQWVEGRWDRKSTGWVWVEGRWR